jgi:DNA-binding NarL/FixJ family response regulator
MSGIDGIQLLKQRSPSTQIIMLTMYDDGDNIFHALCNGASGYLLKDSSPEKIVSAINEVLAGGVPMSIQIARKVLDVFTHLRPKQNEYDLSHREKEVLQHLVNGLTKAQFAEKLFLSYHTINSHLKNVYSKLQVHTRSGAIAKVFREKLL